MRYCTCKHRCWLLRPHHIKASHEPRKPSRSSLACRSGPPRRGDVSSLTNSRLDHPCPRDIHHVILHGRRQSHVLVMVNDLHVSSTWATGIFPTLPHYWVQHFAHLSVHRTRSHDLHSVSRYVLTFTSLSLYLFCMTLPKASSTACEVKFSEGMRLMKCFCRRFSLRMMS